MAVISFQSNKGRGSSQCKASPETQCGLSLDLATIQWDWMLGYRWEQKRQVDEVKQASCQRALDLMPTGLDFIQKATGSC